MPLPLPFSYIFSGGQDPQPSWSMPLRSTMARILQSLSITTGHRYISVISYLFSPLAVLVPHLSSLARLPAFSTLKWQTAAFDLHRPVSGINSRTHFVNQILITLFYTLTTPHNSVHHRHHLHHLSLLALSLHHRTLLFHKMSIIDSWCPRDCLS